LPGLDLVHMYAGTPTATPRILPLPAPLHISPLLRLAHCDFMTGYISAMKYAPPAPAPPKPPAPPAPPAPPVVNPTQSQSTTETQADSTRSWLPARQR